MTYLHTTDHGRVCHPSLSTCSRGVQGEHLPDRTAAAGKARAGDELGQKRADVVLGRWDEIRAILLVLVEEGN